MPCQLKVKLCLSHTSHTTTCVPTYKLFIKLHTCVLSNIVNPMVWEQKQNYLMYSCPPLCSGTLLQYQIEHFFLYLHEMNPKALAQLYGSCSLCQ